MQITVPLLPEASAEDLIGALAIVALISDPDGAKKRLAELTAERAAAEKAIEEARLAIIDANARHDAITERENAMGYRERDVAGRETDVLAASTSLSEREKNISAIEAAHQAKVDLATRELADREDAVVEAEKAAQAREEATTKALKDAMQAKASWEAKVKRITEAAAE